MSFFTKYAQADNRTLIEILENPSQYAQECLYAVHNILTDRDVPHDELIDMAKDINRIKASDTIKQLDPVNDDLVLHKSYFLNREEIRQLYVEELDQHMKNKEGFRFNVWLYALGGV